MALDSAKMFLRFYQAKRHPALSHTPVTPALHSNCTCNISQQKIPGASERNLIAPPIEKCSVLINETTI